MNNETPNDALLAILLNNQLKLMAQNQVIMIQQARLVEAVTGHPTLKILEQGEELYQQELNKLRLANLSELRGFQGKPRGDVSGGGLGGAG